MKKIFIPFIALLSIMLSSCKEELPKKVIEVIDHSFEISADIIYDEVDKEYFLFLALLKGDDQNNYKMRYSIDGDRHITLIDENNRTVESSSTISFRENNVLTYLISEPPLGDHTISFAFETERYSQEFESEFTVENRPFYISASVVYDETKRIHNLFLSLVEGDREVDYNMSYSIDDNPLFNLLQANGKPLEKSSVISFKDIDVLSYTLPELDKGEHIIDFTFKTPYYTQDLEVKYEVKSIPFVIHTSLTTDTYRYSAILFTLKKGLEDGEYYADIDINGSSYEKDISLDFSKNPVINYIMPTLRPGKHDVKIVIRDGYMQQESNHNYTEPVRFPVLGMTLSKNSKGQYTLSTGSNPYKIVGTINSSLVIKGRCDYIYDAGTTLINDDPYYSCRATEYMTKEDSRAFEDYIVSGSMILASRDSLANAMTTSYEISYIYSCSDDGADGENSPSYYYSVSGSKPAYYRIISEAYNITASFEKVSGVTYKIDNQIGEITFNGKKYSKGVIEYKP